MFATTLDFLLPSDHLWNSFVPSTFTDFLLYLHNCGGSRQHIVTMEKSPTTFSAEAYFETQPPPSTIGQDVQSVRQFLKQQQERGRKVVLVTVRGPVVSPY